MAKRKQQPEPGSSVLEVLSYPDNPNVAGVFSYVQQTHVVCNTGEQYDVKIYSSVYDLVMNNLEIQEALVDTTLRLVRGAGDVGFMKGQPADFFIWFNREDGSYLWMTTTQAKSYFGSRYEPMFGRVERQSWSREAANA